MKAISNLLNSEAWRSVILVVIGFLLAQLKDFFAQRKERREAVAVLLSDLLEVRHQFVGIELLIDELASLGNLPEHVKSQLRVVLDSLFPNWQELHDRYDKSVTAVARLDPLLSFQLRSKDFVRPVMRTLHSLMGQDSQAAAILAPAIKNNFVNKVEGALNESILKLARRQSLWCWYKTRRTLRDSNKLPDDAREAWESIKAIAKAQIKAAPALGVGALNISAATMPQIPQGQKQPEK
jgi:hypothetical protein